jgi:hypothetical protein
MRACGAACAAYLARSALVWWIVWLVIMVLVPCLEGLHVIWELRAPVEDQAGAEAQRAGSER